jgi:competence protein ComEC
MPGLPRTRFTQNPLLILAAAMSAGILSGHWLSVESRLFLVVKFIFTLGVVIFSLAIAKSRPRLAALLLIVAFALTGLSLSGNDHQQNRLLRLFDQGVIQAGDPVELTGTIQGQPEPAPQSFYLILEIETVRLRAEEHRVSGAVLLMAPAGDPNLKRAYEALELRHGARVRVMTTLDRDEEFRNPGVLPFTEYLDRKGFDASGVIKSPLLVERLSDGPVLLPLAWLYEWREQMEREFAARFSNETAGVLDAALLGNRYNVPLATAERFRTGGTFHVLVIAGLHISFIGGIAFVLARWFTKRRLVQFLISAGFLWAYTIAVGAQTPVVRAALMFTLVVLAPIVWRRANSLNVIGGAALMLLVFRPTDLYDPSFQLTFASVLAIVSISVPLLTRMQSIGSWRPTMSTPYPPDCPIWFRSLSEAIFWREREWRADQARSNVRYRIFKTPLAAKLERWRIQAFLRFSITAIVVSASVQLGMLPLLIIYFHRISFASIILNIFVGVLMALVGLLALASIVVAHLNTWAGSALIAATEKLSWLMSHAVDPLARAGLASIRLPHYSGLKAIVYVFYFVSMGFLIVAMARWKPLAPSTITKTTPSIYSARFTRSALAVFLVSFALIVLHPLSSARPDGRLHFDFLDVGQGDSALLTMPDGTTLLVDGGGKPNFNYGGEDVDDESFQRDTRSIGEGVVSEFLWSRGLDRVDYILATHADADHIDGLNDVARNFRVRGALVARTPTDDPEYARFAETMKTSGVDIQRIGAGDVLRFGNVTADVLWPVASADADEPSRNNDSVMLRLRFGQRVFLLTGDIEKQGETGVLREGIDLHSDLVKVAHHGSRTSSIEDFVAATKPSLAIISVGRRSMFGHPNAEVVERWRASGAEVMTTGERGTITVATDGRNLTLSTFVR